MKFRDISKIIESGLGYDGQCVFLEGVVTIWPDGRVQEQSEG